MEFYLDKTLVKNIHINKKLWPENRLPEILKNKKGRKYLKGRKSIQGFSGSNRRKYLGE